MVFYFLIVLELVCLYFLSILFAHKFAVLVLRFGSNQKLLVATYSIVFLPGIIVHELSHFFMAAILAVPIGQVNIIPEVVGKEVRFGSVSIEKVDFLRRALVGVAPLLVGTAVVVGGLSYLIGAQPALPWWQTALVVALVFQISNTMFSSHQDLEALPEALAILGIVAVLIGAMSYWWHINIGNFLTTIFLSENILSQTRLAFLVLLCPIMVNILLVRIMNYLVHRDNRH